MRSREWRLPLCCALAALALSGCQTTTNGMKQGFNDFFSGKYWKKETKMAAAPGGCPQVKLVEDLRSLSEFTDMSRPSEDNRMSTASFVSLDSTCEYDADKDIAAVQLMMDFDSRLGPKGRARAGDKPSFVYPYFVAVTTPGGEIVAKEVYAVATTYDSTGGNRTISETLQKLVPLDGESASGYELLVGFQLSEEQLAYNRLRKDAPGTIPEASTAVVLEEAEEASGLNAIAPAAGRTASSPGTTTFLRETRKASNAKVNVIEQKVVVKNVAVPGVKPKRKDASAAAADMDAEHEADMDAGVLDITEPAR